MSRQKDIIQIIEELVNSLDYSFNCTISTILQNGYKLSTSNTYWLYIGQRIEISGFVYQIKSLEIDSFIVVEGLKTNAPQPLTGEIFLIPKPTFKHGTARKINEEIDSLKDQERKLLFWLWGVQSETLKKDNTNPIYSESKVVMFLFAENYSEAWETKDHYDNVIRPIKIIFDLIYDKVKANKSVFAEPYNDLNIDYLPDWGQFNNMKGFEERILDEEYSGLLAETTFNIKKDRCS